MLQNRSSNQIRWALTSSVGKMVRTTPPQEIIGNWYLCRHSPHIKRVHNLVKDIVYTYNTYKPCTTLDIPKSKTFTLQTEDFNYSIKVPQHLALLISIWKGFWHFALTTTSSWYWQLQILFFPKCNLVVLMVKAGPFKNMSAWNFSENLTSAPCSSNLPGSKQVWQQHKITRQENC